MKCRYNPQASTFLTYDGVLTQHSPMLTLSQHGVCLHCDQNLQLLWVK